VDTSAAYFDGKDENDNVEMMRHAKMLRGLAELIDGGPTILVTCHPVKNYSRENLLPRGGGAFLNEIDGNLVCQKTDGTMAVEIHWQGKFRGPDFAPIPFKLEVGTCERLKDSKGRPIWTVTAAPMSATELDAAEDRGRQNQEILVFAMQKVPRGSIAELAKQAGWYLKNGNPNRSLVQRVLRQLKESKLAKPVAGRWELTKAGKELKETF
jgi:hypothetical protein